MSKSSNTPPVQLDAVIVGAGFAGIYQLYSLRRLGLSARVLEAGEGVGGTWFWNRYPGARCDVESLDYSYSFSEELQQEWDWKERYAPQPDILRYINHVVDRFDLRRDIQLNARVVSAIFDEKQDRWLLTTEGGERFSARYCIMATGCLSIPQAPDFPGLESFQGRVVPQRQLAARRRGLCGQTRGPHRHGLQRCADDTGDCAACEAPHRVSAHRQLQRAGAERADHARAARRGQSHVRRAPRTRAGDPHRPLPHCQRQVGHGSERRRSAQRIRVPLAGRGRGLSHAARLQRPDGEQGVQRPGRRVRAQQDSSNREGPGHGRAAVPEGRSALRHQAPVCGHRLLPDLQPRQRETRQRENRSAARGDAERSAHAIGPGIPARRDRLRHRIRCHDRRAEIHRRARLCAASRCATNGNTVHALTWAWRWPVFRTCSSWPVRAVLRC